MGKTKLVGILTHVEPEIDALLMALKQETGIPRSALVRQGIELILLKYGKLQPPKGKTRKG